MAFSMMWGTGFEAGSHAQLGLNNWGGTDVETGAGHTGDYSLNMGRNNNVGQGWVYTTGSPTSLYVAVWVKDASGNTRIYLDLDDDSTVSLRFDNTDNHWDLYIDGSKVADGSFSVNASAWHHVQIYASIANSGGAIQTKVEGIDDIDYSGDTQPGTSDVIDRVRLYATRNEYFDDFCFGTGGWPGDIRFEALVPNGDTATADWTPSTGADHYALVDEQPPSDADYVESVLTGDQDKYTLEDFDITNKDPLAVVLWVRAKKDEADAHQIKLILDDGTEDIGAAEDLLTSYTYLHRLDTSKPSTGDWEDADLDALEVGVESVIV